MDEPTTIILGTTTVDLLLSGLDHIPVPDGDEFTSDNFTFCSEPLTMVLGGNGANTAYVLAGLGGTPALCSAIGRDPLGAIARGWLDDGGVDSELLIQHHTAATATTTVIADAARNRQSFHHAGATARFGIEDLPGDAFERAEVLLVTGYQLLPGWRPDGMAKALQQAARAGATTLLDIGPAIDDPPTLRELAPMLPDVTYLLANAYELRTCVGIADVEDAAGQVLGSGAEQVIVKRGAEGAIRYGPDRALTTVPGFDVDVHSTVGAGDAFNAGLIHALRRGRSVAQAVCFANATAALVVAAPAGVLSAPSRHAVEQLVQDAASSES